MPVLKKQKGQAGAAIRADDEATIALDISKQTPQEIAASLLSHVPSEATSQSEQAKKLMRAFLLVTHELNNRSDQLARTSTAGGADVPVHVLHGSVSVPPRGFKLILTNLRRRELLRISRVAKCWLSAARSPQLWERLGPPVLSVSSAMSMKNLLALMARPQFSQCRALCLPGYVKLGKTGAVQIGKCDVINHAHRCPRVSSFHLRTRANDIEPRHPRPPASMSYLLSSRRVLASWRTRAAHRFCPLLEELDVGYAADSLHPKEQEMLALCGHLPQLAAVRFDMWCISESGVGSIVGAIGARLRVLCVQGETITGNYIGDGTLIALTTVCPNLERFTYVLGTSYWNAGADGLSERGVVALVRDGKRLARLELEGTQNVGLTAFQDIAQMLGGGGFAACGGASSAATAQGGGAADGATDGTPESEEADPDGDVLIPPADVVIAAAAATGGGVPSSCALRHLYVANIPAIDNPGAGATGVRLRLKQCLPVFSCFPGGSHPGLARNSRLAKLGADWDFA